MNTHLSLQPDTYYLLRCPLLPVDRILEANTLAASRPDALRDHLSALFRDPLLEEAIYTASPELHQELEKFLEGTLEDPTKMTASLYKYLSRMSTRCTPYGLFAGCSRGTTGDNTEISLEDAGYAKQSRLDMIYVCELIQFILASPGVRRKLTYYTNNSLYPVGDHYRYIEYKAKDKKRSYSISSCRRTPYLDAALGSASGGRAFRDIVAAIASFDKNLQEEDICAFVEQLIDDQLLISELEPTITGSVYFDTLPEKLEGLAEPHVIEPLRQIRNALARGGIEAFREVHRLINTHYVQTHSKDLIQTDLFFRHSGNTLGHTVVDTIASQASSLFRLSGRNHMPELEQFKKLFTERFEEQEIPLLTALDVESGIGYGSRQGKDDLLPLLEGIKTVPEQKTKSTQWDPHTQMVNRVYERALQSPDKQIILTDEDLDTLPLPGDLASRVPSSLFLFGSLLAGSTDAVDRGDFVFHLGTCYGPSAANLLGRFCHGDASLLESVRASIEATEPDTGGCIHAEVVHLPEARTGNILIRPHLRTYEIPFLGISAAPAENQVPVQDLLVSVRGGRVVLRSRSLDKVVIPRLSTAHNHTIGLPIYRFLCDVQREDLYSGFFWRWENLTGAAFLPRVTYKNLIIAKATWRVYAADVVGLAGKNTASLSALRTHLATLRVPSLACLTEFDNELLLDLDTDQGLQILLHQLRKKGHAKLSEYLGTKDRCFIRGADGTRFTNELIIPLINPGYVRAQVPVRTPERTPVKRTFMPGEEWLYFKLYGGTKATDRLLTDHIRPLADQLLASGLIRSWFFIRYNDPGHHIRFRLNIPPSRLDQVGQIMALVRSRLQPELDRQILHRVQLDTYERELERYGHENTLDSEVLFFHDSQCTIRVIDLLYGEPGETYRWLLALRGLDMFLEDLGLDLGEKKRTMERLAGGFFQEFKGDKALMGQLNDKYRKESRIIQDILDPTSDAANDIEEAVLLFEERRTASQPVIASILERYGGSLTKSEQGFSLLASYVHMYVNRFFVAKPRLHELTLYHLMTKHYTSAIARQKNAAPRGAAAAPRTAAAPLDTPRPAAASLDNPRPVLAAVN